MTLPLGEKLARTHKGRPCLMWGTAEGGTGSPPITEGASALPEPHYHAERTIVKGS